MFSSIEFSSSIYFSHRYLNLAFAILKAHFKHKKYSLRNDNSTMQYHAPPIERTHKEALE